jgi:hypothetical protein
MPSAYDGALHITPSYTGGLSGAINDADAAGIPLIVCGKGSYATDTVVASDHSTNPDMWITIKAKGSPRSVCIQSLTITRAHKIRLVGVTLANQLMTNAAAINLPLFDTAGLCLNSGIKVTPLVLDQPLIRICADDPYTSNAVENLVVTVNRRDIQITGLATDASGIVTTTANSIIDAVNADPVASQLVFLEPKALQDGTGHVQGGFPWCEIRTGGFSTGLHLEDNTWDIEVIDCLAGRLQEDPGCKRFTVAGCTFPAASFSISHSLSEGDPEVQQTRFVHNKVLNGYNTDCIGPRPASAAGFEMTDNLFYKGVDPNASSTHVDTFQPIFGGRDFYIARNRIIEQQGQCFFMTNYLFHQVVIENNLMTQRGSGLTMQFGGIKNGIIRFNTFDVTGMLWDDADSPGEINNGLLVYNNITNRWSRATGVPVGADYNIVETAGTGWTRSANETTVLPTFVDRGKPTWDYHFLDASQPGVGTGTPEFRSHGSPATDLDGRARDPLDVDQGCYVRP